MGSVQVLARHTKHAKVLLTLPERKNEDRWSAVASGLVGDDGFFRTSGEHSMLFIPRGATLVVTFDNLDIAMEKREDRMPWGFRFIEEEGHSMLGVMANGWTWYREPWVDAQFLELAGSGFFERFEKVVFYGASMGGYAAAAFSAAVPGATVIAFSPQSILDKSVVPWETRYKAAWHRDYSGPFGDAAEACKAADEVHIVFDPYQPLDASHVARFGGENLRLLRCPLIGHKVATSLQQMGLLKDMVRQMIAGDFDEAHFRAALRVRRSNLRFLRDLSDRCVERQHPKLARVVCNHALGVGGGPHFRRILRQLEA
jgi:hypothetical protein